MAPILEAGRLGRSQRGAASAPSQRGAAEPQPAALVGAALFGVLAVWFHRRHHLRWTTAAAGLAGAPLLLGLLLAVIPAILDRWGLLPT